ncbi:hypothetical protein LOK74_04660 [Brevibacillus humidisoli]|uniref:hypothetical protein n=1 Tax=Brevibacillus humidisoli TaxID=2895522 RepID=UPI001E642C7B|nr:hypothetical protein [Brevibacillus humidisoli]UFJ41799.1 hypothetical protein LOK74_04660 [Brevibacillus humidisoli]
MKILPYLVWIGITLLLTIVWVYQPADGEINEGSWWLAVYTVILGTILAPTVSLMIAGKPRSSNGWLLLVSSTLTISLLLGIVVVLTSFERFTTF